MIVCCKLCGRDTENKTSVCSRCYGPGRKSEEYGRKRLPHNQAPFTTEDEEEPTSHELYQGESIRDDI